MPRGAEVVRWSCVILDNENVRGAAFQEATPNGEMTEEASDRGPRHLQVFIERDIDRCRISKQGLEIRFREK